MNKMESISVICDNLEGETIQGIGEETIQGIGGQKFGISGRAAIFGAAAKTAKLFDVELLKPKINEAIQSIVSLIDEKPINDKGFEVSELEFKLSIDATGEVSILSVVSGSVTANSGITIRIGKKRA